MELSLATRRTDESASRRVAARPARRWVGATVFWLVSRAVMAFVLIHGVLTPGGDHWTRSGYLTGDLTVHYWPAAQHLVAGQVPYLSFPYEYPPGSLPFLAVARWLGHSPATFAVAWVALMVLLDGCVAVALARRVGRSVARGEAGPSTSAAALWLWLGATVLMGPLCLARNDLIVAAAFLGGFLLLAGGRPVRGGAMWAFAVLAKIWPVVPLAVWPIGRRRGSVRMLVAAVGVLAATAVVLAFVGALGPMVQSLAGYHGDRPLEIESSWAVGLMLVASAHGLVLHQVNSFGSFNLAATGVPAVVQRVAYLLTELVQVLAVAVAVLLRARRRAELSFATIAWLSLATVAAGLTVAPVLSPQYELWVIACACAVLTVDDGPLTRWLIGLVAASALGSQLDFPYLFHRLQSQRALALVVTSMRDVLLLVIAVVAALATWRSAQSPPPTSRIAPVT
ncbi:MAG: hypothetical protein QOK14_263 [Frankiaceae bacterium]|nr:hypothetical protein [Frankiaceae bacterium]